VDIRPLNPNALASLAVLFSDDPALQGQALELTSDRVLLGRSSLNDLIFPKDTPVSRQHAVIEQKDGQFWLSEVVTNDETGQLKRPRFGTYVNEAPAGDQPVQLKNGDVIRLGPRVRLQFRVPQPALRDPELTIDAVRPDFTYDGLAALKRPESSAAGAAPAVEKLIVAEPAAEPVILVEPEVPAEPEPPAPAQPVEELPAEEVPHTVVEVPQPAAEPTPAAATEVLRTVVEPVVPPQAAAHDPGPAPDADVLAASIAATVLHIPLQREEAPPEPPAENTLLDEPTIRQPRDQQPPSAPEDTPGLTDATIVERRSPEGRDRPSSTDQTVIG
jgi:predicted component of type VI protein secretion system